MFWPGGKQVDTLRETLPYQVILRSKMSSSPLTHSNTPRFTATTTTTTPHSHLRTTSPEPIVPKPRRLRSRIRCSSMAAAVAKEILPPSLDSTSEPPALFDGTTRLYIAYICPYAQRPWIVRNYKGLQEKIELVSIDLKNRPAWYKEKVYSGNKVPCLEHHNEVKGESLDLIKYIDANFDGPTLLPDDFEKKKFAEELISYSDSFNKVNFAAFTSEGDVETNLGSVYDKLEDSLSKFDGPFFLGEFSLVEIVYAPFIERFQIFHTEVKNYDITKGRAKLAQWIEELNTLEAYKQTRRDPQEHLAAFKQRFGIN